MSSEYIDAADKEIQVNDYIVYAITSRSAPQLRYGKVIKLKRRKVPKWRGVEPTTMPATLGVVAVERTWGVDGLIWQLVREGRETTVSFFSSLMVIAHHQLPDQVKELFEEPVP